MKTKTETNDKLDLRAFQGKALTARQVQASLGCSLDKEQLQAFAPERLPEAVFALDERGGKVGYFCQACLGWHGMDSPPREASTGTALAACEASAPSLESRDEQARLSKLASEAMSAVLTASADDVAELLAIAKAAKAAADSYSADAGAGDDAIDVDSAGAVRMLFPAKKARKKK